MHACFGLIVVFFLWWRTPLFFGVHVSKLLLIITEFHIGIASSYYIGDEDLEFKGTETCGHARTGKGTPLKTSVF